MPSATRQRDRADRLKSATAVAAIHLAAGYAFVVGLAPDWVRIEPPALKLFDVAEPPPPPPEPPPEPKAPGEAAPANLKAEAAPVAAPEPIVQPPIPLPTRAAETPGTGAGESQGASDRPGPGTGAGGVGDGFGGGGVRARQIAGRITDDDYPRAASRARQEGEVLVRFTVSPAGDAVGCTVLRSSGHAELDQTTCRLIKRRFRFRPARNAAGDPVPEVRMWEQRWWLEGR